VTIRELGKMAMSPIGYSGPSKSDGTPRKLDITRINGLGSRVSLSAVSNIHGWFKKNDARETLPRPQ
jgi:hypothetical protein